MSELTQEKLLVWFDRIKAVLYNKKPCGDWQELVMQAIELDHALRWRPIDELPELPDNTRLLVVYDEPFGGSRRVSTAVVFDGRLDLDDGDSVALHVPADMKLVPYWMYPMPVPEES